MNDRKVKKIRKEKRKGREREKLFPLGNDVTLLHYQELATMDDKLFQKLDYFANNQLHVC